MWTLWKEALLPGTQRDARGRQFTITPDDVRRGKENFDLMLRRGVPVPATWEHVNVEAGDPEEWKARYAKYTFAHLADSRINDRGALEFLLSGRDPKDRDQLLKTKFCSPKLYRSYSDSRGGEYRGTTVAHLAITPTPVQFWQRPFELSRGDSLYLSFTPEGDTVADDKKPEKKDDAKGGGSGEGGGEFSALCKALRGTGMNIPDEVKDISGLIIAVKASGGGSGGGGGDDAPADDDFDLDAPPPSGQVAPAGGPPMLMSNTPQQKKWAQQERRDMKGRVKALFQTGRIARPTAAALLRRIDSVEMSFTGEGEAVCPVLPKLAELEKVPAWTAWKPDGVRASEGLNLSNTATPTPPASLTGDKTKGSTEATNFLLARIPDAGPTKATGTAAAAAK